VRLFEGDAVAELERRLPLAFSEEQLAGMMEEEGVDSLAALAAAYAAPRDAEPLPQAAALPPLE
jgi:hypothetical protein